MSKVVPTKPLFIMLYGYPGCGKSYFARQLVEHFQAAHVYGDRVRNELFETPRYDKEENEVVVQLMDYMSGEFLTAGLSVVYDTNALRIGQRKALRETAERAGAQPLLLWFQIDAESCFTRISKRDKRRSDDKYSAPSDRVTFDRIAGAMQNPQAKEEYIVISGKHVFSAQATAFLRRLRELGLIPATTETPTRVVKPGLVNLIPATNAGRVDFSRRNITIR